MYRLNGAVKFAGLAHEVAILQDVAKLNIFFLESCRE